MGLKPSALTELMHAVLDGEATDAETRELQKRLASDPAARVEFDHWKDLFSALHAVPKEHAPEGLVAAVTSGQPKARRTPDEPIQLFAGRRVLAHEPIGNLTRSVTMTEQSSRRIFARRRIWLGVGLAAAVAVVVAQIAFDFPLPKDLVGTVVPAQRYRAAQNGSEQVQLANPVGQTAPDVNRAIAEKSAAESALSANQNAQLSADHSAALVSANQSAAQLSADHSAALVSANQNAAQLSADHSAALVSASQNAAQLSADHSAALVSASQNAAQQNANLTAQQNASLSAQKNASLTAQQNASLTAQQNASLAAQQNANLAAQQNANLAAQQNAALTAQRNADRAAQGSFKADRQSQQ